MIFRRNLKVSLIEKKTQKTVFFSKKKWRKLKKKTQEDSFRNCFTLQMTLHGLPDTLINFWPKKYEFWIFKFSKFCSLYYFVLMGVIALDLSVRPWCYMTFSLPLMLLLKVRHFSTKSHICGEFTLSCKWDTFLKNGC